MLNMLPSDLIDENLLMQLVALSPFVNKAKKISRDNFQTKDSPLWYAWQLTPKSYSWNGRQANSAAGITESIEDYQR